MSEQPKYKLGADVCVEFIGKITAVSITPSGEIEYRVTDGKCTNAYVVKDSYLYPLPGEPK